jgi:hypothetical protein
MVRLQPEASSAHRALQLATTAYQLLIRKLKACGNDPGDKQQLALIELVTRLSSLALGRSSGRHAFALATGTGKTSSVIAFCRALDLLGYDDVSVVVAQSRVDALCELKRELMAEGIPESKIGLLHTYTYDPSKVHPEDPDRMLDGYASEPTTERNDERPVLLVTHQRLKQGDLQDYGTYRGKQRSIVIYDESLIVSRSRAWTLLDLRKALGYAKPSYEDHGAVQYVETALGLIEQELARQEAQQPPQLIRLAQLHEETLRAYAGLFDKDPVSQPLADFLRVSTEDLRVIYTGRQEGGVVWYTTTIPEELRNIAVLDASWPIRLLEQMDRTLQPAGRWEGIKRYDRVTIHHLRHASGRDAMTKDFRGDRKVSREVVRLLSERIPKNDPVLVVTFKPRSPTRGRPLDFAGLLQRDLREAGIDPEERLVLADGRTVGRISFLTWGAETGANRFRHCRHVIFAGVLHRSDLDVAGHMVGQQRRPEAMVPLELLRKVVLGEVAHGIYQAMSRGACRLVEGDQAHPMDAWLIYPDEVIREHLGPVLPGARWEAWEPAVLKRAQTKRAANGRRVAEYLQGLPVGTSKVSLKALGQALPELANAGDSNAFGQAVSDALQQCPDWERRGRTLYRRNAYGFTQEG